MQVVIRITICLLLGLLFCGGYVAFEAYNFLQVPPETNGRDLYFDVLPRQGFKDVARSLEEAHLISNAQYFRLLARYMQVDQKLKAGRFALNTGWLPLKILDTLVYGRPVLYRVTVPEGLSMWQTAHLLSTKGFVDENVFLQVVQDPSFLRHHGIPFANAEGFLMPDTYLLKQPDPVQEEPTALKTPPASIKNNVPKETAATIKNEQSEAYKQAWNVAGRLVDNFWHMASTLWPQGKKPEHEKLRTLVILASIVEKETGLLEERPRVAGVYTNRLQRNMLLQADPTVIYGLGPSFQGKLRHRHLEDVNNPYNTYQRPGLPPGPICSFGRSALAAALRPEEHKFLYFVASGSGGHVFSVKLEEHNRAVEQYRKWVRSQQNKSPK